MAHAVKIPPPGSVIVTDFAEPLGAVGTQCKALGGVYLTSLEGWFSLPAVLLTTVGPRSALILLTSYINHLTK